MIKISRNVFVFFILCALMLSTANVQAFAKQKKQVTKSEKATAKSNFILKSVTIEATCNAIVDSFFTFHFSFFAFDYKHIIYKSIQLIEPLFENVFLKILFTKISPTQAP